MKRRQALSTIAMAGVGAIAGCSSSDEAETSTDTATSTATPEPMPTVECNDKLRRVSTNPYEKDDGGYAIEFMFHNEAYTKMIVTVTTTFIDVDSGVERTDTVDTEIDRDSPGIITTETDDTRVDKFENEVNAVCWDTEALSTTESK